MVALLVVLALLLAAAPASAATVPDAPAGARLVSCHRSPSIDQRTAVVSAWMRPLTAGKKLALKLDLYQRNSGGHWTLRSDVPGLGTWTTPSDAGVGSRTGDVFKYRQAVGRLVVPAAYRFHVAFRWLDAEGTIVREAALTTGVCRQPDQRPDLVLDSVSATPAPGDPALVRYAVVVSNDGQTAAARSTIAATFPGDATPGPHLRSVRALAPGKTVLIRFTGPGCVAGGQPAAFLADPSNAVEETDETNNALSATCPAP